MEIGNGCNSDFDRHITTHGTRHFFFFFSGSGWELDRTFAENS